jgi:cysteine desulfurase / selenocysteine lyase
MITATPTGSEGGAAPPAWLPDEATLTRLATEFYGPLGGGPPALQPANAPQNDERDLPVGPGGPAMPSPPPVPGPGIAAGSVPGLPGRAWPAPPHDPAPSFYFIREPLPGTPHGAAPEPEFPASLDVAAVRRDFPILSERVNGRRLVWLDNAATTQKPQAVIDRLAHFYEHENSNVHRAAHTLAARATDAYEDARATTAKFLGASSAAEIVFTRGSTEAINLVAQAWGGRHITSGDEIVLTHLEHHANIVPWQLLAEQTGARLRVAGVDDSGQVLIDELQALLSERTRMVAVAHVSNVLGTVVPVGDIIEAAHRAGACVLVDGAQAVAHLPVDVGAMDADFYVFSGHKIFGPTGIGALYARQALLDEMPPWQGGGNMIHDVTFDRTTYNEPPARFEAGTGNIADAVGLGAALEYVNQLGRPAIERYEHELLTYGIGQLSTVPGLRLLGTARDKASVLTFTLDGYQPGEIASALDQTGIAVRAGHHCAQPILRRYGLEEAVRPSLAMYNTADEVDLLVSALRGLAAGRGRRAPVQGRATRWPAPG